MTKDDTQAQDSALVQGRVKVETYESPWWSKYLPNHWVAWINRNFREPIRESDWSENLIMDGTDTGVQLIATAMSGQRQRIEITKAAMGDDTTAPADGDTDLGNPIVTDVGKTNERINGNVITLEYFLSDQTVPDGDYEEFGVFVLDTEDDYSSRNLFARALFSSTQTKASGEDKQVNYEFTFNN